MTMGNAQNIRTQETQTDLVTIAKRISPRVDEVVKSMYPPLDPRLLEARYCFWKKCLKKLDGLQLKDGLVLFFPPRCPSHILESMSYLVFKFICDIGLLFTLLCSGKTLCTSSEKLPLPLLPCLPPLLPLHPPWSLPLLEQHCLAVLDVRNSDCSDLLLIGARPWCCQSVTWFWSPRMPVTCLVCWTGLTSHWLMLRITWG